MYVLFELLWPHPWSIEPLDGHLYTFNAAPSGLDVPVRITGSPHSAFRVDYTPVDVGK